MIFESENSLNTYCRRWELKGTDLEQDLKVCARDWFDKQDLYNFDPTVHRLYYQEGENNFNRLYNDKGDVIDIEISNSQFIVHRGIG